MLKCPRTIVYACVMVPGHFGTSKLVLGLHTTVVCGPGGIWSHYTGAASYQMLLLTGYRG